MVSAAQNTAFFTAAAQMAIPRGTATQLANEGILVIADLIDFDKDTIEQIANNLRRPSGRIPDPNYIPPVPLPRPAPAVPTIPQPPFVFGAKSQKRLLTACDLVRYYNTVGRTITGGNMMWTPIMRNFGEQWKALVEKGKEDDPETPPINKALPIIKWIEVFKDHLHRCIGIRKVPLAYVIREEATVPAACPAQEADQPYSEEHASIEKDLIMRASHVHGLFRNDNQAVYFKLEEATRGTAYADSIKPFQREKDGRSAFTALKDQYAGVDKWDMEIKKSNTLLNTRKWKGNSNFTLEKFVQLHRNSFVSMRACSEHVTFQLPTPYTRVGYLLDAIESSDPPLLAAMANIEDDTVPTGKRHDFEKAAAYLLPKDPVARRRTESGAKTQNALISDVTSSAKAGIGKTGVHLRWHTRPEYKKLPKDQNSELYNWRQTKDGKQASAGNDNDREPKRRKVIAAAVEKEVTERLKKISDQEVKDQTLNAEMKNYIMSLMSQQSKPTLTQAASVEIQPEFAERAKVTLSSILKKAKG